MQQAMTEQNEKTARKQPTEAAEQGEQKPRRKPAESSTGQRRPSSSEGQPPAKRPQRQTASREASSSAEDAGERKVRPKLSARKAAAAALKQMQELTTRTPESVVGVAPHDDGWHVNIEVVESARIPDTADIMAEYEVVIDHSGEIVSYSRGDRYFRGRTGSG